MRNRGHIILPLLLAAAACGPLEAQDSGAYSGMGTCVSGSPRMYFVVDAVTTGSCAAGGGTGESQCCCLAGVWANCATAGSGAPSTPDYLVKTADGGLSAERVVTDTSSVTWDWGTSGQAKANVANVFLPASSPPAVDAANGVWGVSTGLVFEGSSADANETTVVAANATADRTLTLPNETGTLLSTASNYAASVSAAGPATTATALAANPGDCSTADGTEFAWRINASGDLSCASVAFEPYSDVLDIKNTAADTPDDDFSSGSLAGKWTVVSGASGTVDLFETGTSVAEYDLATRSGWLLLQVGKNSGNAVSLRQDYTLPDGSSIVAALAVNSGGSNAAVTTNNSLDCGLNVNNNNTSAVSGTYTGLYLDAQAALGPRPLVVSSVGSTLNGPDSWVPLGGVAWLRISRVGLSYSHFVSADSGLTWFPLGIKTLGSAADNVWVYCSMDATITGQVPISGFDWVRLGTNNLDPW